MSTNNHALVFGASGLIGWSIVDQLLSPYPSSPSPFARVTALANRPLKISETFWPEPAPGRPELSLAAGVNLMSSDDDFERLLEEKVPGLEETTHVYYFVFKEDPDPEREVEINVGMMRRVLLAVTSHCPNFKFFVYPGGTRGYGIYTPDGLFTAPLHESLADNLPAAYRKTVSYPHYRTLLTSMSQSQPWTWCELCPDAIIGFTPNGSGYSLAGHWAVYLYTYKLVYGEGVEVPFPGTKKGFESLYSETSAAMLARVGIWASLHPDEFRERIFNVADSATPGSMRERWPQIVSWFGLKGVPPPSTASADDQKPSDFMREHRDRLEEAGVKGVDIWNAGQLDSYGYWLTFDRHLSLDRLSKAGFGEERSPENGWWEAFEMFRKAGMIR